MQCNKPRYNELFCIRNGCRYFQSVRCIEVYLYRSCWRVTFLAFLSFAGGWLYIISSPLYIQCTYLAYQIYTLCKYTTVYIGSRLPAMAKGSPQTTFICTLRMLNLLQFNGKCIRIGRLRNARQHSTPGGLNKLMHCALPATQKQHISLCNEESCISRSQEVVAQEQSFCFQNWM